MKTRQLTHALAILLVALCLAPSAWAIADLERTDDTPTAWYWLYGQTGQQITDFIIANNVRLVDLEVESTSPIKFTAAFLPNTGLHSTGWWWYYNLSGATIATLVTNNSARLIDIERYEENGVEKFAVIMVPNTGAQGKAWWYYYGVTSSTVTSVVTSNNARIVDIESWDTPSGRRYAVVMIRNTGSDYRLWWYYLNASQTTITNSINANNSRLIEYERRSSGTFDAVLHINTGAEQDNWWWYYNVSASQLTSLFEQNGARITDIDPYYVSGSLKFSVVMINNLNDASREMAESLGYGGDGATGFYLKEVNGPVVISLQPDYVFEPASSIKIAHHLHAMREVMLGQASLSEMINYSTNLNGSCPIGGSPIVSEPLSTVLLKMMQNSNNNATEAIAQRFGVGSINATSNGIGGMPSTSVNHLIGCGNDAVANPNAMTLGNATTMHERMAQGLLLDNSNRDTFRSLMQNEDTASPWWFTNDLQDVIIEEATSLGIAEWADVYWENTQLAWKPGGYTLNGEEYRSISGWVSLPNCGSSDSATEYVFGLFIDKANNTANADTRLGLTAEMFRDAVRAGLQACPTAVPGISVASGLSLLPNYPNPFNPATTVIYELDRPGLVQVTVHDLRGRLIATLVDGERPVGRSEVYWNGQDGKGRQAASGVYLVKIQSGAEQDSRMVVMIK